MVFKRKKNWIEPVVQSFGSSDQGAEKKASTMFGANCGESVIRYGPQCKIRVGQECRVRIGTECHPIRYGPSCAPRIGSACMDRMGPPCKSTSE